MDLGSNFGEFSNFLLIASQLENVGWGQIGVNISFEDRYQWSDLDYFTPDSNGNQHTEILNSI